ncbi:adenosylcobinamide-GDP ribazoletransferase [Arcobacter sp. FWKO B]|uniref:adenosylcobinamide-GDP ribazoletransferase n=1 Tax=Arcobacter sp. FWKO B TaxID=2593672 RepID=UPI0018A5FF23|nr:adenosylcobinamide-GDP ribazoletransferase [Arcobacter sp. FWKO B]QOG12462.1 adenosylcobinamide-GDP ribazoletransferase [Arcobacter sp. FWKO B]
MKDIYLGFKFAFSYFTILPINFKQTDNLSQKSVLSSMLFFFPIVGIFLGSVTILAYIFIFQSLGMAGAVISAVLYMVFYGFIHTEAIVDVTDALYAKHSGKDPYMVIKEPTIGAMGLLYVIAFFLIKVSIVSFLLINSMFFEFIIIALISRFSLLVLIKINEFKSTFVNTLKNSLSNTTMVISLIASCIIGILLIGNIFFALFFIGIISAILITKVLQDSLGFLNGDVLGTSLELTETLLFISIALWL